MIKKLSITTASLLVSLAANALEVRAFNLTDTPNHRFDAATGNAEKTQAQKAVDFLQEIGVNHVVLNPVATMDSQTSSTIKLKIPLTELSRERQRYQRLIRYIHSKNMTVGIRPIILVVQKPRPLADDVLTMSSTSPAGNLDPVWHGNIKPADPAAWFESLRSYLDTYATVAKSEKIKEFTIAAELYSMTVGLEDQWKEQPYGFPREWKIIFDDFKRSLGPNTRIMYDMNYTDATVNDDGTGASGGEIERWRYRLVDLKPDPSKPETMTVANQVAWEQLRDLWLSIDVVGIDMYRSLLGRGATIPLDYDSLVSKLEERATQFAVDIDTKLFEISDAVGTEKQVILKELGFKSCTNCFIDPFTYDDPRKEPNIEHQAAAYQAIFNAFVKPSWSWLKGIAFWDVSTDPIREGAQDPGFSPKGKEFTENVIRDGWNLGSN